MRKLIIKLLAGEYIFPSNFLITLSLYVLLLPSITVILSGRSWGWYMLLGDLLILLLGIIKLFYGKGNMIANPMRVWSFTIPCFFIAGVNHSFDLGPNWITIIFLTLFFLSFLGSEIYFKFYPVKYSELDDMNKFSLVESGLSNPQSFQEMEEYGKIVEKYKEKFKKYNVTYFK